MGFTAEDLTTNKSINIFSQWLKGNCQPNYRKVRIPVCVCVCETQRLIVSRRNDENTNVGGANPSFTLQIRFFLQLYRGYTLLQLTTETLYNTSWQ